MNQKFPGAAGDRIKRNAQAVLHASTQMDHKPVRAAYDQALHSSHIDFGCTGAVGVDAPGKGHVCIVEAHPCGSAAAFSDAVGHVKLPACKVQLNPQAVERFGDNRVNHQPRCLPAQGPESSA